MALKGAFRLLLLGGLATACTCALAQSEADRYPAKPIHLVSPFPPGGATDLLARLVARHLSETWGQPVIVDNRGGANGIIGTELVARASPDGYTLLLNSTSFSINPSLYKLPYDSIKDFAPVTQLVSIWQVLVVNPEVPARTVQELIELARQRPDALNYASFGSGSIAQLAGELFKMRAKAPMTHVPYKGLPPALVDLITGRVQVMFPTLVGEVVPYIKTGKLRGLAVTSSHRLAFVPDLPTMAEAGVSDYESVAWVGLFFPAATPRAIVSKLQQEVSRGLQSPAVKGQLEDLGYVVVGSTPEEFQVFVKNEIDKSAAIVKTAGVKAD